MTRKPWRGALVAGLALACSGQRAERRGAATASADAQGSGERGGGTDASSVNERATNTRPGTDAQAQAGATGATAGDVPQPKAEEMPEIRGTVAVIGTKELTIRSEGGGEEKLKIDEQTLFHVNGRQASLAELQQGSEVRASYEEREGDKHAITVTSGATKSP